MSQFSMSGWRLVVARNISALKLESVRHKQFWFYQSNCWINFIA